MRHIFCATCRSVLRGTTACEPGHRVVDLADDSGRAMLHKEHWTPSDGVRKGTSSIGLRQLPPFLFVLAVAAVWKQYLVAGIVLGTVAAVILVFAIGFEARGPRTAAGRSKLVPTGALAELPRASEVFTGAIVSGEATRSPLGDASCVGWALEVSSVHAGVTLRDGETAGFAVKLRSGETLNVAPGMLRIVGRSDKVASDAVHAHVASFGSIVWDEARALELHVGDLVEITAATLVVTPDFASNYRDAPLPDRVTTGAPLIRRRGAIVQS